MQQATDSLKKLHEEIKKDKPRSDEAGEAVNKLREAAALIASDAVMYMHGNLLDKALEATRAIADFCNEYEKEE